MTHPLPKELQSLQPEILDRAFTHRSLRGQAIERHETNERLEFLGDAVLELVVSKFLIEKYPKQDEGTLTRYRASLVRTESLAAVARQLYLGEHLKLSTQEPVPAADLSDSLLADTFEASIGAIYQNSGYDAASQYIHKYLLPHISEFITSAEAKDAKTLLQEKIQALGQEAPQYTIVKEIGPDHDKTFTASVTVPDKGDFTGTGASKQKAQQAAAEEALEQAFSLVEKPENA